LLESFSKLECSCPLEFVIIDDCSDDGTGSVVKDWNKPLGFADVIDKFGSPQSEFAESENTWKPYQ
jgi:glycosyltransferase involved in cell wall biosynthesis